MKTFTTYAEKKAKQFLNLLQGYTKGIRFVAVLTMLLTLGIGQIWALDANNARIYFDNTNSKWTYVQLVGGHGSWSSGTALTKITNTNNLWTTAWSWGGYNYFMFIDAEGSWPGEGKEAWQRKGNFNYSATVTHNVGSNTYFYFPSSSTKGTGYTTSQQITDYSKLNYNQTVQQQLSTDGGTSYSASTISIATVKVSSFSLGSATATSATSNSKTIALGNSSATCSAARTATVTYEVSDEKPGYTFVGWYDGTTQKSTNKKFEAYQATGEKTITARFKENTYSVTISAGEGGTVSPSGSKTIGQVTKTTVTATPNANYEFVNWTATGGVVVANTSSASTTITATAAGTLTANFRSTATNSLTVAAGAGIASVTGSTDPVTLGSTYAITATPKTGYTFSTWTANPAANATFGSATTANTTVTVKNGSVTVTASATETLHAITVQSSDNNHGTVTKSADKAGIATSITITATPKEGYRFVNWTTATAGITIVDATDASTTVTATAAGTITANFEKIPSNIVYLKPNDGWKSDNARFEAYAFEGGDPIWKLMTDVGCNGDYYYCEIPATYNKIIFVRMDPNKPENDFNSKWNQTNNLTIQNGEVFTITDWNAGNWTGVYTSPTYDIKLPQPTGGTIEVLPKSSGITLNEQVTVTMTASPGYSFQSGTIKIGNQEEQIISTTESAHTICGPTTITATWKPDSHKVTFDANGHGTAPDEQSVDHNEKVEEPEAPTADGYTFGGWYTDADCTNAWNFNTDVVTEDMTLYAKWTANQYIITWNANGGTVDPASSTYTYDGTEIQMPLPTRNGYSFNGWWTASSGGKCINDVGKENKPTDNVTYYAHWTENKHEVTIAYICGETNIQDNKTLSIGEAEPSSIEAPAIDGYAFSGWTLGSGVETTDDSANPISITTKAEGNYTLTANYIEVCVYFVNTGKWDKVYIHAWKSVEESTTWPGTELTEVFEQIGGYDVYKYSLPADKNYDKIIFNAGGDAKKTAELVWENGKYYVYYTEKWVEKDEVENNLPNELSTEVYLVGTMTNWTGNKQEFRKASADATTASVSIDLPANTFYEFKIIEKDVWKTNKDVEINATTDSPIDFYSLDGEGNNCRITTKVAGNYIFEWDIENSTLLVTYPTIIAPVGLEYSVTRMYKEETINEWIAGDGAQATPYQFYNDEMVRLTVTPLTEVAGLTAYYKVGETEQTANTFDLTNITTEVTPITITTYYKDSYGNKGTEATTTVYFQQVLTPQLLLITDPVKEISLEKVQAGTTVELTYSATYNGYIGSVTIKENETILATTSETKVVINRTPTDIGILTFTATTEATNGRVFETSTEVAVYKLVTIKVNDPQGLMNKVYLWRDATDAEDADIKTEWPGESFLQNFGTWHIFTVKYPYYTRFIVNDSKDFVQENGKQTENYDIPNQDACYKLSDGKNGSGKYELTVTDCPGDLAVSNIDNITLTKGEQKIVSPSVQVSLGNKLSDVTATVSSANTTTATAIMSGTNIIVYGHAEGRTTITVKYTLHGETVTKKFQVTVERDTHITIQVKVPIGGSGTPYDNIGWNENSNIKIHYWHGSGHNADIPLEFVSEEASKYKYLQAEVPLHTDGKTNFLVYYEYLNDEVWRKSPDVTNVSTDGCYTMKNEGYGTQPSISRSGDYCWEEADEYQVKIVMQNGKEYSSNIVTSTSDILSFFAPGKDEVNYRSGVVMLYKNGNLHTTIDPATFSESNVYTAQINDDGTGLTNVAVYTGNYYVRTYGNNDWGQRYYQEWTDEQRSQRKFTYFVPREGEFYNHYWIETLDYYDAGKDVSGWVANRYNNDLAGKLQNDKITDNNGKINFGSGQTANVRFGYDPRTNYFGRAILKGSGENQDFLNVHCDNAFSDAACQRALPYGTSERANKFTDMSNWVYQSEFYVEINGTQPNAKLYIDATAYQVNSKTPKDHLLGYEIDENDGSETDIPKQRTIMGSGTTNGIYHMVVIYDFKTNRLITAWKPEATNDVSTPTTVKSDVIFIRHENDDAPQINLSGQGRINELQTLYFALELERGDANANNRHEEQYWFTLPFDCVVGEISGVPGYMETWGIQRYRGDLRAQKGWFLETPTFWEWLSPTDILKAGEGYLLAFDKKAASWAEYEDLDADGEIRSILRLYFPSLKDTFNLQQATQEELTVTYPDHTCTITYKDRYKQDSNWKVIGTTSYNNATIQGIVKDTDPDYETWKGNDVPNFRYSYTYEFNSATNERTSYTYTPEDGKAATYKSFFSYMVQFAGTITWNPINKSVNPEGLAARRYVPEGERTSFTTRLELTNATGEKQDQTFVALDENGTTGFDQNKDLNKVINSGANIYTLAENISYAGNTLAMEKQTIPVGVVIAESGEYTFRMPDGTDGISVTLVDNVTGTHTDMLMDEYTVTLDAGTIENRFYLVVDPDRTATSVENIGEEAKGEESKGVEKFLIDGKLFIRTADGIFDAKGQRM